VVTAASAGDEAAQAVLTDVGRFVAAALARITPVLDPSLAVLGGGLAVGAGKVLLTAAQDALAERLSLGHLRAAMPIRLASAGPDAGALGAAALIHDERNPNRDQDYDECLHSCID
jgi:glucokinase